jgi:hypothetical protein
VAVGVLAGPVLVPVAKVPAGAGCSASAVAARVVGPVAARAPGAAACSVAVVVVRPVAAGRVAVRALAGRGVVVVSVGCSAVAAVVLARAARVLVGPGRVVVVRWGACSVVVAVQVGPVAAAVRSAGCWGVAVHGDAARVVPGGAHSGS